jgi:formylglycine-generating enzyme required for sulfatase activity
MPHRPPWLIPALIALILFVGNLASSWLTADLQAELTPYRYWIWGVVALAALTAVLLAVREAQREPPDTGPHPPTISGRVTDSQNVLIGEHSTQQIVADSENVQLGDGGVQQIIEQVVVQLAAELPRRGLSEEQFRSVAAAYLALLINRYRYLDFKGMGVSDRVPLRLPLLEMYVPLRARREMPDGETWAHNLRLAGRQVSAEEADAIGRRLGEPGPVLELLNEHDGVIVLGDPGAGKTTFLKYLALLLAFGQGERLRFANHLPILIPLAAYANALDKGDVALQAFLGQYYRDQGIDLPVDALLSAELEQGRALLLLDGLDEVSDEALRTTLVRRLEHFVAHHRRKGNKFVLTSRIVGYRAARPSVDGLVECTLVDFGDDEIADFVAKWTAAIERAVGGDTPVSQQRAQREGAELLATVQRGGGVRLLAANPLLLTILALMKRQGVALPERRAQLYDTYVKTLLRSWNLARNVDGRPGRELNENEVLKVLAPLALWMHTSSPGVGLVKREEVRRRLIAIYAHRGDPQPAAAAERLLRDVRDHASLLLERGPGSYGFIHLTFQEYLAAVALVQQGQQTVTPIVTALIDHLGVDAWREVSLLAIGHLGLVQQRDEAASAVIEQLLHHNDRRALLLAGAAVKDVQPDGVTPTSQAQTLAALQAAMRTADLPLRLRLDAALLAADLGDQPADLDGFVPMPATAQLGDAFRIGRYPVTNAQFRCFVTAGGYRDDRWWQHERGRYYRDLDEWTAPRLWDDDRFNHATQPVVGVSWYEAAAYCAWLTAELRKRGEIGASEEIRLPTQPEWLWAARTGQPAPADEALDYPWAGPFDPRRANTKESDLKQTTPVHMYPTGVTPAGVWDMAGNVWEWTKDEYQRDSDGAVWYYLKGGSYYRDANDAKASAADRLFARNYWPGYDGFRVVVVPLSRAG